jgi:hypothetical protein
MQAAIKQLELLDWLEQYPLLHEAHTMIRSQEYPDYLRAADGFAQKILAQLDQPAPVGALFGTDLVVGIDRLFESLKYVDQVTLLFNQLSVPATLKTAMKDIVELSQSPLTLLTAVRLELAHLMIAGYEQLSTVDTTLADRWLSLYHHTVLTYLRQQAAQTSLALLQNLPCLSASFEWATQHYITRFDETASLPMYVMGVVSFSPHASHSLFDALIEILPPLNQLLRLAQDIVYDPNEILNTGIFAYASEHNLSLAQAVQEINGSTDLQHDISNRVAQCYALQLAQTQQFIQTAAAIHDDKAWLLAFGEDVINMSKDMIHR